MIQCDPTIGTLSHRLLPPFDPLTVYSADPLCITKSDKGVGGQKTNCESATSVLPPPSRKEQFRLSSLRDVLAVKFFHKMFISQVV